MRSSAEGPVVKVGQVWMSNDKRESETKRWKKRFRVEEMLPNGARCVGVETHRTHVIRLDRFRATATGYVPVEEPAPKS